MEKVIAIFGAGDGLGMSSAFRFGREGYRVALVSRDGSKLDGFVADLAEHGIDAAAFPANLIDSSAAPALIGAIRDRFDRIDVVLYNPSTSSTGFTPAAKLTANGLQDRLALYLLTPMEIVQAVMPEMIARRAGAILATHGIAAILPYPNLSGPGTVTAATRNYLHALNLELMGSGVFAGNLVVGGFIERGSRYRAAANFPAMRSLPDGTEIPVFDADDLADLYWGMVQTRDRPEVSTAFTAD